MGTRHERVILEAQDNFSSVMAKAAVSTAALRRELDSLSRNAVQSTRTQQQTAVSIDRTSVSARRASASIDQLSGRVRILADVAAILGPSLAPVGAVGIAGVGGLVNQLALAALGAGTAVIAFQGVGTALEAVNKAALEPTAENLAAAEKALADLAPAARTAVREMSALKPVLQGIRDQAAEGFFPGLVELLDDFEARSGDIESVVHALGGALGDLMGDAGDSLASRDWDQFFVFLAQDGARTLTTFGQTVGNLTKGLAQMWMAFDPLNDDFSDWLLKQSQEFDEWTDKLNESEGFREFIDYVRESGPQVASAFSEIGSALLQVMDAASPLGGPVLAGLEAVASVVSTIADSDLGTPIMAGVAALALFNRTMAVTAATSARMAAGGGMIGFLGGTAAGRGLSSARSSLSAARADVGALAAAWGTAGARTEREAARVSAATDSLRSNLGGVARGAMPAAGALGAFGFAASGVADSVGMTNTAMGTMMGFMVGGGFGAAVGAAGGAMVDLSQISKDTFEALQQVNDMLAAQGGTATMTEMETLTAAYDQAIAKAEELKDAITSPDSFGDWMKGIKSGIEDMYGANDYEEVTREADRASEQLETLRSEAERLADLDLETAQWEEYTQAVARVSEEAEAAARAFINMGDSVNDSEVSLGGWLRELEENNRALREFRQNAVEAGKNGLTEGLIADLQELGPEGARRMAELANASESEIARANKAWRAGEREVAAYEAQLSGLPNKVVTEIAQNGMPSSLADIRSLISQYNLTPDQIATLVELSGVQLAEGQLQSLARDRTATIRVHTLTSSSQLGPTISDRIQYGNVPRNADGGFVPKTGLPYADRHLYLLADGEGVTTNRNGETDRFRDVVEAINAGYSRAQVRGMLASGGIVGTSGPVAFRGGDVRIDGVWRDLERGIRILTRSVDKTEGTLDKARDRLDRIRDKMDEAGENSVDQMRPDLWAVPDAGSPWTSTHAPTADPLGALRASNADLVERRELQSRLYARGLRKGALSAALEGSNEDIESLLDNRQVSEFKRLYNRNARLQTLTASEAGKYAYGKQERAQIAEVKDIKVDLRLLRKSQERTEKRDREWQKANKDVGKNAGKATSKTASRGRGKKR